MFVDVSIIKAAMLVAIEWEKYGTHLSSWSKKKKDVEKGLGEGGRRGNAQGEIRLSIVVFSRWDT